MPGIVVLTASAGGLPGLADQLHDLDVTVEEHPLLRFVPPSDWSALDAALDRCERRSTDAAGYAAVVFTSPRAARAVAERLRARGTGRFRMADGAPAPEIWAAGPGTAQALAEVTDDVRQPDERAVGRDGAGAALADALLAAGAGSRGLVCFPCGDHRRDELPARLRQAHVTVDEVVCYRSALAAEPEARAAAERATILVVASPSVAELLARACPEQRRPALVAIGPTTAAASGAAGWPAAIVAEQPTARAVGIAVRTLWAGSDFS